MIKTKVVYILLLFGIITIAFTQVDTLWTRRYTSPGAGSDYLYGLSVDNDGNVYITGSYDYLGSDAQLLTIKYNSAGDTVWTRVPARAGSQMSRSVAVGASGNVYLTGYTMETGNGNYLTVKYRPNGDMAWAELYNGPYTGYDFGRKLVIDAQENVYVSGYSQEVGGRYTHATVKYDSSGTLLWAKRDSFGGAGSLTYPADLELDNNGNPCIVSKTRNAGGNTDYVTTKYNASNGETLWVRTYDGSANGNDEARGIAFDNSGNVYVTGMIAGIGTGNDVATIKYNAQGDTQWVRIYNNPDTVATDGGYWIKVDNSGNVYVYGNSYGINGANSDLILLKYDSNGNALWRARYDGPGGYDIPVDKDGQRGMVIDQAGNIYLTGTSRQAGSTNENDFVTLKYNPNGILQWETRYDYADSFETAYAIDIDNTGNVYVAGRSAAPSSYYDCVTIKYRQSAGIEESNIALRTGHASFMIYPKIAKTYFIIRLSQSAGPRTVKLFDITGKLVKEIITAHSETRMSLAEINPGIYFVQVDNEPVVNKMVVTK